MVLMIKKNIPNPRKLQTKHLPSLVASSIQLGIFCLQSFPPWGPRWPEASPRSGLYMYICVYIYNYILHYTSLFYCIVNSGLSGIWWNVMSPPIVFFVSTENAILEDSWAQFWDKPICDAKLSSSLQSSIFSCVAKHQTRSNIQSTQPRSTKTWRFPITEVPLNHPFPDGIFRYK